MHTRNNGTTAGSSRRQREKTEARHWTEEKLGSLKIHRVLATYQITLQETLGQRERWRSGGHDHTLIRTA